MSPTPPLSDEENVERHDRVRRALSEPRARRALVRSLAKELLRRDAVRGRVSLRRDPTGGAM
jgi:hypothetical protein